jgi:hypothetical protein
MFILSIMSYTALEECMKSHNCQLITKEEEYNSLKAGRKIVKVNYIASCGHTHSVYANVFKSRGTGVICPSCTSKKNSKKKLGNTREENGQAVCMKMEDDAIDYLRELISHEFRVKKTWEGCLSDMVIQPLSCNQDLWLPIQVKTTCKPFREYSFTCNERYPNCIIICLCLSDKKMWMMKGSDIHTTNKISIGLKKSKYDINIVTKENILIKFNDFYMNNSLFSFEMLDTPISIYQQKEREFRKFVEVQCPFIPFSYPDRNALVFDFMINGYKVQEKVGSIRKNRCLQYVFNIFKSNGNIDGCHRYQRYASGDNDFYWLNLPDKKYFFVLPESILLRDGYISNSDNIEAKTNMSINMKDMSKIKYKEYLFDYSALDVDRLKGMFGL